MGRTPLYRTTRRHLLQLGGGFITASILPACVTSQPPKPMSNEDSVVIVGGGLAGLTTAYYLAKSGQSCRVYEGSERLGGRVFTQQGFNPEGMSWERGAEFIDSDHEEIMQLARELGVKLLPLKNEGLEEALYWFNGRAYRDADFVIAAQSMLRVMQRDLQVLRVAGEIVLPTFQEPLSEAAQALDRLSLAAYLDRLKDDVDPWLLDLMRTAYTGEYGVEVEQQSALNLLGLFDGKRQSGPRLYTESGEPWIIQGGSTRLIQALEDDLAQRQQAVLPAHRLQAIRSQASGLTLIFDQDGKTVEVKARRAVIALPFSVLRKIEGIDKLDLSPVKKEAIRLLGYGTNTKIGLGFQERFWRHASPTQPASLGTCFTSLPSQLYWDSSRQQKGRSGILTNLLSGLNGLNPAAGKSNAALSDLEKMFRGAAALHDQKKQIQNWGQHAFALGSTMCPKPGQYSSLMGVASEPERKGTLLFAGEHCSVDYHGFMNGAVASGRETALRLLAQAS